MHEILRALKQWRDTGRDDIALATISRTQGSSLRSAGTRMALNRDGDVLGSVSSGCVDGDVIAEMEALLENKLLIRTPSYGVSDELAQSVGLSCGGQIDVLVEKWDDLYDVLMAEMIANRSVAFASRLDTPTHVLLTNMDAENAVHGSLGNADLDTAIIADLKAHFPGPYINTLEIRGIRVFVEVIAPPPELFIFGATDIGVVLAQMAYLAGFQVMVIDARRTFLQEERFPNARIRFGWPQHVVTAEEIGVSTSVVVLYHDEKFDIPALTLALRSRTPYIGLLGSRRTQAARRETLREHGFSHDDLAQIHGPVGLDIGGRRPALIALSILAEVVAVRNGRHGGTMRNKHVNNQEPS